MQSTSSEFSSQAPSNSPQQTKPSLEVISFVKSFDQHNATKKMVNSKAEEFSLANNEMSRGEGFLISALGS